MAEPAARGPLLRYPFLWAFLVGIILITLIRPCLRRIPEPPPVTGRFPDVVLEDRAGRRFDREAMRGTVWIVAHLRQGCGAPCDDAPRRLGEIAGMYSDLHVAGIGLLRVLGRGPEGGAGAPAGGEAGPGIPAGPSGIIEVSGDGADIRALAEAMGEAGEQQGPGRLAIVDGEGNLRGSYLADADGFNEVYNRTRHVREATAASGGGPSRP